MKGTLKDETPYKEYGFVKGLLPNTEYEILSVKNNCCGIKDIKIENPLITLSNIPLEILNITYEIGDEVKIIKNIYLDDEIQDEVMIKDTKEELGNISFVKEIIKADGGLMYLLKDSCYARYTEELEIVKTKYQLELEKSEREKKMKLQERNKDKSGIIQNTNGHDFVTTPIIDIEVTEKDSNKVLFKGAVSESEVNNNIKVNEYQKGDTLKVIDGIYKNIEGNFIDYVEGFDSVLIQTDDKNRLYINSSDVMLIKKKVNNTHEDEKYNLNIIDLDGKEHYINVKFHKNKTYVTLVNGIKARCSCYKNDKFNEKEGIIIAFYRAMIKKYEKALKDLDK